MKRKYEQTQKKVDEALLAAIQNGVTDNVQLKQVIKNGWEDYNVGELVDCFSRVELSAAKQRLRARGYIEITTGNQPVLVSAISHDDAEFIDQRRRAHIMGEIKTRLDFNTKYGRAQEAVEASRQLSMFESVEVVANELVVST